MELITNSENGTSQTFSLTRNNSNQKQKYLNLFLKKINSKDYFIFDFEAVTDTSYSSPPMNKFEISNYRKQNEIPISVSIYIKNKNLSQPKLLHFNFMNNFNDLSIIWNDYILKNYSNENVFVWGGELEMQFLNYLVGYTSKANFPKLKKFFQIYDLHNLFSSKLWLDKLPILDLKINSKIESSLNRTKIILEKFLQNESNFLTEKSIKIDPISLPPKTRSFYNKINRKFNSQQFNNEKPNNDFLKELENYNNKDVQDIYFILTNIEKLIDITKKSKTKN